MATNDILMFDFIKPIQVPTEEFNCTNEDLRYVYNKLKELNVNLSYFIKNANTVKFVTEENLTRGIKDYTYYDATNNVISTSSKNYKDGITHEALHLGSSVIVGSAVLVGFNQSDFKVNRSIGVAVNEGYTALIDERYFGDYTKDKSAVEKGVYPITKQIVSNLELTLGTKAMLESYFNVDLYTIYTLLSKLMGKKRTMQFLYTFDAFFHMSEDTMKFSPRAIHAFYPELQMYITEAFYTKITDKYRNGSLSANDYKMYLELVQALLSSRIRMLKIPITEDLMGYRKPMEEHYEKKYKIRQKNNCLVK